MSEITNKTNQPRVSIITIIYNGEKYIEQCIKSIIGQNYQNLQYIIIDGGSTDSSLKIIAKYKDYIDVIVSEKDNGISDAFNKGIARANGEIIGILNCDDLYSEDALQRVAAIYQKNKCSTGLYFGDVLYFNDDNRFELVADDKNLWKYMSIFHPATFVTKSVYDQLGGYSQEFKYAMDSEFIHRCLYNKIPFFHVSHTLANFRLAGTSDKNYIKSHREFYLSVKKYNYSLSAEYFFYWNVFKKIVLHTKLGQFLNKRRHLLSWLLSGKSKS